MKKLFICFVLIFALAFGVPIYAESEDSATVPPTQEDTAPSTESTEPTSEASPEEVVTDPVVEDAESDEPFDFKTWFEDVLLPYLLSFLSIAGVALVYLLKPIAAIKKASGRFDSSADAVEASKEICEKGIAELKEHAAKSEEQIRRELEETRSIAQGYIDALSECEKRLAETLKHVERIGEKTEQMVYLGFSNSPGLVGGKGIARRIAEVEEGSYEEHNG